MRKLLIVSALLALSASAFAYHAPTVVISPNVGVHHHGGGGGRHYCRVSDARGRIYVANGRHACRRATEKCRIAHDYRGHRHGGRCFVVR